MLQISFYILKFPPTPQNESVLFGETLRGKISLLKLPLKALFKKNPLPTSLYQT